MSEQIHPEDIGRLPMVEKVAAGVQVAMERAGITDPADVHYVQTKTPLLTLETITDAKRRGHDVWTEDTLKSMDVSNSTTALGIAVALGEIEMPKAEQIHKDLSLYSSASCSSGVELDQAQIVVLGNVRGVGGWFRIGHSDEGRAGRRRGGVDPQRRSGRPAGAAAQQRPQRLVVNIFSKCEADPTGRVRDRATSCSTTRRALAPADQVVRRRSGRVGDRRPGRLRVGGGRPPGPGPAAARSSPSSSPDDVRPVPPRAGAVPPHPRARVRG